jgi:branched-chain amino acid transport system substrate-binding protein
MIWLTNKSINFIALKRATMRTSCVIFISSFFLMIGLMGCKDDEESQQPIKIGVLLSLSGTGSSTGESCAVAMDLAREDILHYFQSIGLQEELELYPEDSQTDPVVALQKITRLNGLGCSVVVGPYSSAEVLAVKDYCDQNGIIAISPSSVAISLGIAGDNIYRMVPDDRNQAKAMVEMLKDDKKKHLVAIVRDDLWARELVTATGDSFVDGGGSLDAIFYYPTSNVDFSSIVEQLSDALGSLLVTYPAEDCGVYMLSFKEGTDILKHASSNVILQQVNWYGGSAYAENSTLPSDFSAAAFAATQKLACPIFGIDESLADKWEPVVERMKTILGRNPEIYALAVYDAIWLSVLSYLSLEDRQDRAKFKVAFEFQCNNYIGISGRTTLNEAGDRAFAIYDFWGVRLFLNEFSWFRTASYNNATGELIRY